MYSFAQRPDTVVLDEPFYAYYLHETGIVHPGRDEVLKSQPRSQYAVRMHLESMAHDIIFVKNMAHHLAVMDQSFVDNVTNLFLIRNPRQIIASYANVIETPTLKDIGIAYQYELFTRLLAQGRHPVVLDSGLLLMNPESVVKQVCTRLGIPYFREMLTWPAGPKPYDGVWAPHWYANVHRSTGFERQPTSDRLLPPALHDLNEQAQFYYEALAPFALQP
jgi:hypothetical protein